MILSKKTREGYYMADHRASPGVRGLPKFLELASFTCKHCQRQVLRDPGKETERHWCSGCDSYLCKTCKARAVVEGCKPWDSVIEEQARFLDRLRSF